MSSEEFLPYREPESDILDSEFRIVLVKHNFNKEEEEKNSDAAPQEHTVEESDLEERHLSNIKTFTEINSFFDKFDTEIAYPNESNIKYDVGSDGLIYILVNNDELKATVLKFIDDYLAKIPNDGSEKEEEEVKQVKKQKK